MAAGLFSTTTNPRNTSRSVVRSITGEILEEDSPGVTSDIWKNDPIGTGLKSTQQLKVDWSDYASHVFFNSAEAKVNLAFDQIINGYPFDGTSDEKETFLADIGGFTAYILKRFDSNLGYFNFDGNAFMQVEDQTGFYAPDLTKVIGEAKATENFHVRGATHEFWVRVNSSDHATAVRPIYQKVDTSREKGVTITYEGVNAGTDPDGDGIAYSTNTFSVGFHISSDKFKAIYHELKGMVYDTWYHVAFVYERAETERVLGYLNGEFISSTNNTKSELDNIKLANSAIKIGTGSTIATFAKTISAVSTFRGQLDEFRIWSKVKTESEILATMHKNIDAQEFLQLYYRFNEPSFTTHAYGAERIVLDYSGNGLHILINGLVGSFDPKAKIGGVNTPLQNEKLSNNYILFPDWTPNEQLNTSMLVEANHYDRNNPNLITKLVPQHYFEEAQFFEGIEDNFETPMAMETKGVTHPIPGHAKLPPRVLMLSFLFVWANFFDDIKLYIDAFSLLDKVTYDDYNQIPSQVILFLSDYYGINLPNPYSNETPSKFKSGENLTNSRGESDPLSNTTDLIWRRILINLPFLLRSRGTIQGIKALMNTLGIEADSTFRFKEFGGAISKQITSARKKKKKNSGFLRFDKLNYVKSAPLWAYRHAPGAPDATSAPQVGEILFQAGDITISTADGPPIPTLFTSGSWAWEGRYELLKTETTASLFRLENDNQIIANLVAMRSTNNNGPDFNIRLFLDGFKTSSDPQVLDIPNVNLWDENPWYISINNEYGTTENTVTVRCIKTSGEYIVEHYSGSLAYTRGATGKSNFILNNHSVQGPIPMFAIHENTPAANADKFRYYIGDRSASYDDVFNYTQIPATLVDGVEVGKRAQVRTTNYSGGLSHMRFWTKSLTRSEQIEHAHNPFSVATDNPINSNSFISADYIARIPIVANPSNLTTSVNLLNSNAIVKVVDASSVVVGATLTKVSGGGAFATSSVSVASVNTATTPHEITVANGNNATAGSITFSVSNPERYSSIPLGKLSTKFEGSMPEGGWQRLRQSFDMLQSELTFTGNELELIDTSQNNDHLLLNGNTGALYKEDFVYTIVPPDFDSNSSTNKVRIRSFSDKETAEDNFAHHGVLTELPFETGIDDRRFSIESSIVNALNEDMINVLGNISMLNEYLGAPEMEYAVEYPEVRKSLDLYFRRLTGDINYNAMIEFQRWFNGNFAGLIGRFIPHTADFLGINFIIESHMLERHKMEYKQGDVHVDIRDRQAFSQEPLILGTIRSEIT